MYNFLQYHEALLTFLPCAISRTCTSLPVCTRRMRAIKDCLSNVICTTLKHWFRLYHIHIAPFYHTVEMCVQRRFTFFPWSLGHKSSVYILAQYAATAHWLISLTGTHLYTWVERSRCGINFLLKEIPVVRAGFEPGTSRSLSQRPTIRPLLTHAFT